MLYRGTLKYIVDSSFYLSKSRYISVAWFTSEEEEIIANGDFMTTVAEEYRHPYAAKICSILSYLIMINNILFKYPNILKKVKIVVGSDYQIVIDNLWNSNLITLILKHLYQIVREIKLIIR